MKYKLIRAVRGYNRFLSKEYLERQGLIFLLRHLHPLDREYFAKPLLADKLISLKGVKHGELVMSAV